MINLININPVSLCVSKPKGLSLCIESTGPGTPARVPTPYGRTACWRGGDGFESLLTPTSDAKYYKKSKRNIGKNFEIVKRVLEEQRQLNVVVQLPQRMARSGYHGHYGYKPCVLSFRGFLGTTKTCGRHPSSGR